MTTTHDPVDPELLSPPRPQMAVGRADCSIAGDGIAVLRLGAESERIVTLTAERLESLEETLQKLARDTRLRGVVVTGPGPGMFCAGADINLIQGITDPVEGERAAVRGRSIFARLQQLQVPVVAAIEGPCLGGGFELTLFCDLRVASQHASTQIGLPEVKLGILPGFGGTFNLPRLVGLPTAVDLILNGKLLKGKPALRRGIVDRLVPSEKLLATARAECERLAAAQRKAPPRRLRGAAWWLSKTPLRRLVLRAAGGKLGQGQARFYPAPKAALACCVNAFTMAPDSSAAR